MTEGPRGGGARLMVGFHGRTPSDDLKRVLNETGARSVIVFSRNLGDASQVRDLVAGVRELVPWPLVCAIDQEGGAVARLTRGVTVFPGNMALGAAGSPELALRQADASGAQLSALGFDINLAPVVDLQTNPANPGIGIRSFGAALEPATALARAYVEGHARHRVACCLKHFPGKGAASVDAHLALPVLEQSLDEFRDPHLDIFVRLFGELEDVAVMTTHLVVQGLDAERPATLSRAVATDLLRGDLGFDGLVISDDLEMGAIVNHWGVAEAAALAVGAGHDVVPICHHHEWQLEAAARIDSGLASGDIDGEEHARSLERIDRLAARSRPGPLDTTEGDAVAAEIARAAVHVFSDPDGRLPVDARSDFVVLAPDPRVVSGVEEAADEDWGHRIARAFRASGAERCRITAFDPDDATATDAAFAEAAAAKRVVLCSWNARVQEASRRILHRSCAELADRLVVAHVRNPFDQALVPAGITALTGFGYRDVQLAAVAAVIVGRAEPAGTMPALL